MSLAGFVLGLALALAAGGLVAWRLWPGRAKPALLIAALAWPVGSALTSTAYFLWLVLARGIAYPLVEALVLAGLAAWVWRARKPRARPVFPARPGANATTLALVALSGAAAASLASTVSFAEGLSFGYWDAWARINLKARFLAAGGGDWAWIFQGEGIAQPDYPLLLECSVARLWRWSGGIDRRAPQVLSVLNWGACLLALTAWVAHLRSGFVAALAGLAFLCKRSDPWWAAAQYGDFTQAAYYASGAGLVALALRGPREAERFAPLLGFVAASAAWCKNEGVPFAGLVVLLVVGRSLFHPGRRLRAWARLAAGLLLGGAGVLVLKVGYAARSYVFGPRPRPFLEDLLDPARWQLTSAFTLEVLRVEVMGGALLVLLAARLLLPGSGRERGSWAPLLLASALSSVFLLVMITTSLDLEWHLMTAVDRLVLQLWPLAILAVAVAGRSPARA